MDDESIGTELTVVYACMQVDRDVVLVSECPKFIRASLVLFY